VTLHKADTYIDAYRAKARASDINELSGRPGRPDLTDHIGRAILDALPPAPVEVLVDVGCGQASLLQEAVRRGRIRRGLGILPTDEEVTRVREHLRQAAGLDPGAIAIHRGTAAATGLPAEGADLVVCNGVLVLLCGPDEIRQALAELHRIARPGALLYLGEVPDADEMAGKHYGDSIVRWLAWVWRTQGWRRCLMQARVVITAALGSEPFVIAPKRVFFEAPEAFLERLRGHGFEPVHHARHADIEPDGRPRPSPTRWNYLVRKPACD
jgi:SAM-dependent methyltransferase